jgi:hypothetical protein
MFTYLSPEAHVRKDRPLRAIRTIGGRSTELAFAAVRHDVCPCRPSVDRTGEVVAGAIAADAVLDPSERLLMEEMDYNLQFRWFVGLNADDEVWDPTVFTKKS